MALLPVSFLCFAVVWALVAPLCLYHCWDDAPPFAISWHPPFIHPWANSADGKLADYFISPEWVVYTVWVLFVVGIFILPALAVWRFVKIKRTPVTVVTNQVPQYSQANPVVPKITAEEMAARVRTILAGAEIVITPINPEYGSWNLHVTKGRLDVEFIWGPLSGFGASDLARLTTPDDTPFDLADEGFESVDEALEYLRKLAEKYN